MGEHNRVPVLHLHLLTLCILETWLLLVVTDQMIGKGVRVLASEFNWELPIPSSSCFLTSDSCCTESVVISTNIHQNKIRVCRLLLVLWASIDIPLDALQQAECSFRDKEKYLREIIAR